MLRSLPVAPAQATVANAKIKNSFYRDKASWMRYRGVVDQHGPPVGAQGNTEFCVKKYKILESDKKLDYYAEQVLVVYSQNQNPGGYFGGTTRNSASTSGRSEGAMSSTDRAPW